MASAGRNTQGVTLIRLSKDEKLVAMARVEYQEGDETLIEALKEDGIFDSDSTDANVDALGRVNSGEDTDLETPELEDVDADAENDSDDTDD